MQVICARYFGRSSDALCSYQFRMLVELIRIFTIDYYATSSRIVFGAKPYNTGFARIKAASHPRAINARMGPGSPRQGGSPWLLRHILFGSIAHQARLLSALYLSGIFLQGSGCTLPWRDGGSLYRAHSTHAVCVRSCALINVRGKMAARRIMT